MHIKTPKVVKSFLIVRVAIWSVVIRTETASNDMNFRFPSQNRIHGWLPK